MRSSLDSAVSEAPLLKLRPGLAGGASSEGTQTTSSASSSSTDPAAAPAAQPARAVLPLPPGPAASPSEPARPVLASPSNAAHVEPMHFAGRLLLIANRLPITFQKHSNGTWSHGPAAGGLVSAMKGVKAASMTWVGWPGTEIAESEQPTIVAKCKEINSFPVFLPKDLAELYYNGFSNHVLWPLFHYIHVNIEDTVDKLDKQWRAYIEANKLFCNAVLQVYEEGDIVWVHDYHLMLLPQFLRAARPNMRIGWFLHTPFPSSEIYRALPYREELLNGVLAADLLGFHIFDYGRHFKSACTRILGLEVTHQGVEHHGRFTQVGTFPIGIDAARFLAALEEEEVQREFADLQRKFKGMKVLLGIDRLDYIKGIPHKLLAVEKFLQHHPEWIGKVVLIQIAVPSRETVIEYQRLKSLTHELVGRVNGRFGTLESVPIHYLDQSVPFPKMCALYRLADLAIITSLRDGMNLVSYEYVVCQKGKNEAGVLILSEFAGAAQSLGAGSIRVNPWNTNQLAHAINQALQMPRDERNHLHQYAFGHITSYTAQRWAQQFIGELNNVCERVSTQLALVGNRWIAPRLVTEDVVSAFQQSRNRVVCLGVVGCLTQKRMRGVTVEQFGQMAQVPQETLDAIDRLSSDPNTTVLIMSALGRSVVDRLLGGTQAWLIPENGFFIRKGGRDSQWEALGDNVDLSWIDEVEEVLNYFVQRTPRSFIEREESYLSWHYRDSDSEWAKLQVRDLLVHLMATPASSHGFEVVRGVKAIQIRPIGVSKGFAAQHCISEVQSVRDAGVDFILCVGSFLFRDEDLFTSLLHYPAPGADKAELMEDPEADLGMVNEDSALQLHSGAEVDDHEPGPTALGGSDGGDSPSVNSITPTSLSHSPITQHIITSSYLPPLALPSIAASPEPAPVLPQPAPVQAQTPSRPEGESSSEQQGAQSDKAEAASSSESRQLGRSHSVFTFRGAQQQGAGTRAAPPTNALGTSFPSPRSYRAINSSASKDHAHSAKRHVFTCTVGRNKPSRAQFHVNGLHDVSNLLQRLAATIPSPPPSAAASSAPTSAPTGAGPAQSPAQQPPLHLAPTPSEAEAAGSQT